jgi:hypothetical protein
LPLPLPNGHYRHTNKFIYANGTNYGPYALDITSDIIYLGAALVDAAPAANYSQHPNGFWYKISDNSGPFAKSASGIHTLLGQ